VAIDGSAEHHTVSRIPVAYLILGYEANRDLLVNFYRNAQKEIDWVTEENTSRVATSLEWLEKEILGARSRGVICKTITDITPSNITYCKRVMKRIHELRHMDGVRAVFGVSDHDTIAMVPSLLSHEANTIQFVHSNSEAVVPYKQLIFEALWKRADPSALRIAYLEQGRDPTKQRWNGSPKHLIDRIYICNDCSETFVYLEEARFHGRSTGHKNMKELPLS
jgi:hypothetical protein